MSRRNDQVLIKNTKASESKFEHQNIVWFHRKRRCCCARDRELLFECGRSPQRNVTRSYILAASERIATWSCWTGARIVRKSVVRPTSAVVERWRQRSRRRCCSVRCWGCVWTTCSRSAFQRVGRSLKPNVLLVNDEHRAVLLAVHVGICISFWLSASM